ncbi:hypothetical protein [Clostridium lundense]|uniref:hypothetical protein n=1 Tax=Clostridium lundense TaxID=319475 RepID=UPI000489ED8B|nr:hypothetical protein [Clostridium lundense]
MWTINKSKFKLFYKDICIGEILYTDSDFPWFSGAFTDNDYFKSFKPFFHSLVESLDKNIEFDESKWDPEWSEFENWSLIDEFGEVTPICMPMIYTDQWDIGWRLRF